MESVNSPPLVCVYFSPPSHRAGMDLLMGDDDDGNVKSTGLPEVPTSPPAGSGPKDADGPPGAAPAAAKNQGGLPQPGAHPLPSGAAEPAPDVGGGKGKRKVRCE